jgi:hypothetical protein
MKPGSRRGFGGRRGYAVARTSQKESRGEVSPCIVDFKLRLPGRVMLLQRSSHVPLLTPATWVEYVSEKPAAVP